MGSPYAIDMLPDPKLTAQNFTMAGIEGMIRANRRRLAELAELECSLAGGGSQEAADSRAESARIIRAKLANNMEALAIRQARIEAGEVTR